MDFVLYQELFRDWLIFLSYDTPFSFEELLKVSRRNRRILKALAVYMLIHEEWFDLFKKKVIDDIWAQQLYWDIAQPLIRLTKENDDEFSIFGHNRLHSLFLEDTIPRVDFDRYDSSAEIAKFFKSGLRKHRFEMNWNAESEAYYLANRHRFRFDFLNGPSEGQKLDLKEERR
ncbi:hypothetical protein [Anoxybacteroides rupiense]|uniref:hypothetical protein n=1 Tax=Anoxybacteroides rupiense TaxID=311460 RepID=UPI00160574CD|nr:hypothetical protein [Anoxybacillus rupiensis]MBB3908790.1 hypothetical protein [Anoxybacillus rupiensis]